MELEGPKPALLVAVAGLAAAAAPTALGATGNYQIIPAVAGVLIAVLAVFRAVKPDEEVPLPALPAAVIVLGLATLASPFLLGSGLDTTGIVLVVAGLISVALPVKMIYEKMS